MTCTACFNENPSEEELRDFCGTESGPSSNSPKAPDIFKAQCATCHSFQKDLTGPKMKDILDRVPSEEWLLSFITNQDSLIEIEDEYTLEIMEWSPVKWNHNVTEVEKKDLDTLINYITR